MPKTMRGSSLGVGLRGTLALLVVLAGFASVGRAIDVEATVAIPDAPALVSPGTPLPLSVDFGRGFQSIDLILISGTFEGDLLDPGEGWSLNSTEGGGFGGVNNKSTSNSGFGVAINVGMNSFPFAADLMDDGQATYLFSISGGSAALASLRITVRFSEDLSAGDLVVADRGTAAVIKVDPATGQQTVISSGGLFSNTPFGIVLDDSGAILATSCNTVVSVDPETGAQALVTEAPVSHCYWPIAIEGDGSILVGDVSRDTVDRVHPISGVRTVLSSGFSIPTGIVVDEQGDIFVSDAGTATIFLVDPTTGAKSVVTSGGEFIQPRGLKLNSDGDLVVADSSANKVVRVDPSTGAQTVISSAGSFLFPFGLAIDANGTILVVDPSAPTALGGIISVDPLTGNQAVVSTAGSFVDPFDVAIVPAGDPGATPTGMDVVVSPPAVDENGDPIGESPITFMFDEVTGGGDTTVTVTETGPPPPGGFKVGQPPTYFDLETTATFTGSVEVCIDYGGISFGNEANLALFHKEAGDFVDVTSFLDTVDDIICGVVDSFSFFLVAEFETEPPVASLAATTPNPSPINTNILVSALIDDSAAGDSAITSASFTVDGGGAFGMAASDGAFDTSTEAVEALIAFPMAGVHEVCVSGVDEAGNSSNPDCLLLAVFDPSAGFVTGGGWIDSPPGAYTPENPNDPDILGKANFGFVSRYKKGTQIPEGQTEFRFQAADLNFHSTSYDWLVIAGKRAQYKGDGSINGIAGFKFMLTAIDDDTDRFRIKIWNAVTDEVVYDNKAGSSDTSDNATVLGGGNIVIHKK